MIESFPLVKVDRVGSAAEAVSLRRHGVELIHVSERVDPRFPDQRFVSPDILLDIANTIGGAHVVPEIPLQDHPDSVITWLTHLRDLGVEYVQASFPTLLPGAPVRSFAAKSGMRIVYAGIEASYDTDPTWILARFNDCRDSSLGFFQIGLLGDIEDAWRFLRTECSARSDELQIDDIRVIARSDPVLLTVDFTPRNVANVLETLPDVRGIAMTLAPANSWVMHVFDLQKTIDVTASVVEYRSRRV